MAAGSTCTTVRGAAKWLLKHNRWPFIRAILPGDAGWKPERFGYPPNGKGERWGTRGMPTEQREFRRAKAGPTFRRRFVRNLRKQVVALAEIEYSLAGITAYSEALRQNMLRLEVIRKMMEALAPKVGILSGLPSPAGPRCCLVTPDLATVRAHGCSPNMRGLDSSLTATFKFSYGVHSDGVTTWKNGNPVGYNRAAHHNYVRSFALLDPDQPALVSLAIHQSEQDLILPDGYSWAIDGLGLCVVHGPDRYHPTCSELWANQAVPKLIAALAKALETRKLLSAQLVAECSEAEGVYVCLQDSMRGGNCRAGSIEWSRKHNLDTRKHYTPMELLQQANGDIGRVRLAVKAATIRHRGEMERGYSVIADHPAV